MRESRKAITRSTLLRTRSLLDGGLRKSPVFVSMLWQSVNTAGSLADGRLFLLSSSLKISRAPASRRAPSASIIVCMRLLKRASGKIGNVYCMLNWHPTDCINSWGLLVSHSSQGVCVPLKSFGISSVEKPPPRSAASSKCHKALQSNSRTSRPRALPPSFRQWWCMKFLPETSKQNSFLCPRHWRTPLHAYDHN